MPSLAHPASSKGTLHVGPLARQATDAGVRTSALAGGRPLWFESPDADLAPSPEAFGSAMLIPAMRAGLPLAIDQSVCSVWAGNLPQVIDTVSRLWHYPAIELRLDPVVRNPTSLTAAALCFSGGVDSFHTLLRGPRPVDLLVAAVGYDVEVDDAPRIARLIRSVRAVAAELGIRAVVISTNLRRHAAFRAVAWDCSHGSALAVLGHLLGNQVGRLIIAASLVRGEDDDVPLGSRWDIDPFFASSALAIDHIGVELWRADKLRAIAHEDLVRRHLRVCWEYRNAEANCCQCEKCVRTMLILATCGQLENYPQFHGGRGLLAAIERLSHIPCVLIPVHELLLTEGLTGDCAAAVRQLVARSWRYRPPLLARAKKLLRRGLRLARRAA